MRKWKGAKKAKITDKALISSNDYLLVIKIVSFTTYAFLVWHLNEIKESSLQLIKSMVIGRNKKHFTDRFLQLEKFWLRKNCYRINYTILLFVYEISKKN